MMEETALLHLEVDQGQAEQQLKKVEGLILDNKKAQQELTKALKQGTITQDEYIDENIRLQQNLKKEQEQKKTLTKLLQTESNSRNAVKNRVSQLAKEYDNLNLKTAQGAKRADELEKELAQLNAQLTKGDKAAGLFKNQIGNYPQKLTEAASQIRVAGVSVGDLSTKLASLANPATAAVGVVAALGAAYARSTLGAKDLAFAQTQLASAVTLVTNQLASFVTSAEDGEGAVTSILNSFLKIVDKIPIVALYSKAVGIDLADIADRSKEIALAQEKLEDLGRLELEIRANASQRLEDNQELMEQIADDQLTVNQRLQAANEVEKSLLINRYNILSVLEEEFNVIQKISNENKEDEELLNRVGEKRQQINAEAAGLERQITKINKLQDDLNKKLGEEVALRNKAAQAELELFGLDIREANAPNISLANDPTAAANQETAAILESSKARQEQYISELKTVEFTEEQKREQAIQTAALREKLDREAVERERATADGFLAIGSALANGLSALAKEGSEEQKALAITGIAIDTAAAIAGAVASAQDIPYPGNLAAMASAIAAVLAAIAEAKAIGGFAEGGWTGPGNKHDVAGYVHADEYVVPKNVNNSPAAQPHLAALERMRTGYADGGYVANLNTQSANNSLLIANAFKNLPAPQVSWVEGRATGNKVIWKEAKARI